MNFFSCIPVPQFSCRAEARPTTRFRSGFAWGIGEDTSSSVWNLLYGQHRMDRVQDLVMAERLGDKGGDEAAAQGVLHEAIVLIEIAGDENQRHDAGGV